MRETGQGAHRLQQSRRRQIQSPGAILTGGRTLILGIGNSIRRDDGVGPATALFAGNALTPDELQRIEVRSLDAGGWNLIPEIEGFGALVVIDAYFAPDAEPGRVRTHRPEAFPAASECPPGSAHLFGLSDALRLSRSLGYHTPDLLGTVTVDVGESCMTFGEGLSPEIEAAVPMAASHVFELVLDNLKR